MSQKPIVQECDQEVQALLPTLPRPEQKALAGLVCGVVLSQASTLAQASAAIPGQEQDRSKHRRAQRLLANRRLDVPDAQQHLLRRVLHSQVGRRSRLDLLVDAVHTGATAHWGGLVTLLVALAWRHRAIPLVWCTRLASDPAQDWQADLAQLLARVQVGVEQVWAAQPRPLVVVLADRGLSGDKLAHTALALGWHFLLRVRRRVAYQAASGQIGTLGTLVQAPGARVCLSGVRVWAPDHGGGTRRSRRWLAGTRVNVVADWPQEAADPWLLVTDLPASQKREQEYVRRIWEEELFRDLKGLGWHWEQSRLRVPARVERLVVVLALATVWMLALGARVLRHGQRAQVEERSRRCYSIFQLGLRWLRRLRTNGQVIHCCFTLGPDRATIPKLS
jgi:hypothetical protein